MNRSAVYLLAGIALGTMGWAGCTRTIGFTPSSPIPSSTPSWKPVGNIGFSTAPSYDTQIFISSNGTPYVAYAAYTNPGINSNNILSVVALNGSTWTPVGNTNFAANIQDLSLYVYNNTPYVAFDGGGPAVMTYNGSAWVTLGPAIPNASSPAISGYNGTPYVAYTDLANNNKATVVEYTGGAWVTVGQPDFTTSYTQLLSLNCSTGTPYLAYVDGTNDASVMKYVPPSWVQVGSTDFTPGGGYYPNLAFYNGTPYIAYSDLSMGWQATVQQFNGGSWVNVGPAGFSPFTNLDPLVMSGNTPCIAVQNSVANSDQVLRFNGSAWVTFGDESMFANGADEHASLAVDAAGNPYFALNGSAAAGDKVSVYEYH